MRCTSGCAEDISVTHELTPPLATRSHSERHRHAHSAVFINVTERSLAHYNTWWVSSSSPLCCCHRNSLSRSLRRSNVMIMFTQRKVKLEKFKYTVKLKPNEIIGNNHWSFTVFTLRIPIFHEVYGALTDHKYIFSINLSLTTLILCFWWLYRFWIFAVCTHFLLRKTATHTGVEKPKQYKSSVFNPINYNLNVAVMKLTWSLIVCVITPGPAGGAPYSNIFFNAFWFLLRLSDCFWLFQPQFGASCCPATL